MLHNQSKELDAFNVFKVEVEKQAWSKSDRSGEYYGRYTEDTPFAMFLKEHGIVAHYTMPGSSGQNGVAERRNITLMDMVWSMLVTPSFLNPCGQKLLKQQCIYYRVPTKVVPKTSFELWKCWKSSFLHTCLGMPIWSTSL